MLAETGRSVHEIMSITGHKSITEVERYTREANQKKLLNMETPAMAVFASKAPSYSRVPTNLLGKTLDHGKASAYAVHLLAIKCGRGDEFVLNRTAVNKPANAQSARRRRNRRYRDKPVPEKPGHDIGERGVQQGIALMKRAGVLQRSQPGRCFAKEKLLGAVGNYVLFDDGLLRAELSD